MKAEKLVGPPKTASLGYVQDRLRANCIECAACGGLWHFRGEKKIGLCVQINVGGRIMAVRRATYLAFFPEKTIQLGRRITSHCKNECCINPNMLVQATASNLLKSQYDKGIRNRREAAAHLCAIKQKAPKVSQSQSLEIMRDDRPARIVADEIGISAAYVRAIRRGESQKAGNPFAGLMT